LAGSQRAGIGDSRLPGPPERWPWSPSAVKAAAASNAGRLRRNERVPAYAAAGPDYALAGALPAVDPTVTGTDRVVAIGTSTGGTQALEVVLPALRRNSPAIVVVQHMPEKFTGAFAERLDAMCHVRVREADSAVTTGDLRTVTLDGELTIITAAEHKERLLHELQGGTGLRVDLSDVSEIDTAGLQVLLLARREAERRHVAIELSGAGPLVAEVLTLADLRPAPDDHGSSAGQEV
jgi:anti-anti-sigma factor